VLQDEAGNAIKIPAYILTATPKKFLPLEKKGKL
jgi:hypothetical protein